MLRVGLHEHEQCIYVIRVADCLVLHLVVVILLRRQESNSLFVAAYFQFLPDYEHVLHTRAKHRLLHCFFQVFLQPLLSFVHVGLLYLLLAQGPHIPKVPSQLFFIVELAVADGQYVLPVFNFSCLLLLRGCPILQPNLIESFLNIGLIELSWLLAGLLALFLLFLFLLVLPTLILMIIALFRYLLAMMGVVIGLAFLLVVLGLIII